MKTKYYPSLEEAIRNKIRTRIYICIAVIVFALIFSVGFYFWYFFDQVENSTSEIEHNLSSYILSQELLGLNRAVDAEINRVSTQYDVNIHWFKGQKSDRSGFYIRDLVHWQKIVPVMSLDDQYFGYYKMSGSILNDKLSIVALFIQGIMMILFIVLISFLLLPIAKSIPQTLFVVPINRLLKLLRSNSEPNEFSAPYEIMKLRREVETILKEKAEMTRKKELVKQAQQVAHDIRSPLQAIITAVKLSTNLPENMRVTISNAANRINDIANNLLSVKESAQLFDPNAKKASSREVIFFLLDSLLSEKRLEYRESAVQIHFVHEHAGESSAYINKSQFKRAVSNIINNSVESTAEKVEIHVNLKIDAADVVIDIDDNGSGIAEENLQRVREEGVSLNKKGGAGLGLSHAIQYIESIGGHLQIDSVVGQGTRVQIRIPRSVAPDWFCNALVINADDNVVIIDDDQSIHDTWRYRFSGRFSNSVIDIYSTKKFHQFVAENSVDNKTYLMDYEFIGSNENGLQLLAKHQLQNQSYLITSNVEVETLRNEALAQNVEIIPKSFVPYIPIKIQKNTSGAQAIYVLIDDYQAIRMAWQTAAKIKGVELYVFSNIKQCQSQIAKFSQDAIFYIDSDLGKGKTGEVFAKELHDQGFYNLYLATGSPAEQFYSCYWLKGIRDKSPPF